jgi:hypothetical protein
MVTVTDFRYTQTSVYSFVSDFGNQGVFKTTEFSTALEGISGVICKPAYSMIKANLTYDTSKKDESDRFSVAALRTTPGRLLEHLSFQNLSLAMKTAVESSENILGINSPALDLKPEVLDAITKLML